MWNARWPEWPRITSTRCCVISACQMEVVTRWPHKRGQMEELGQSLSRGSGPSRTCNAQKTPDSIFIWSSPLISRNCKRFSISRTRRLRSGYFTNDVLRFFVVAQPFECGVTEKTVVCPLSKTDLGHELWFEPAQLFHLFGGDAFAEMARAAARQIIKCTFTR